MKKVIVLLLLAAGLSFWGKSHCAASDIEPQQLLPGEAADNGTQVIDITKDAIVLYKGTEIRVVFAQRLSSKHATLGEKVELRVAEEVTADDRVLIPKGARVIGTVVQGKENEKYGNSKDLGVSVDYVALKDRKIMLTGMKEQKAKTSVGSAVAATAGFGIGGLIIYMGHREAWIREGTLATAYTAEDVVFSTRQR